MNDLSRYIIAGVLIFLIIVLSEPYFELLGLNNSPTRSSVPNSKLDELVMPDIVVDKADKSNIFNKENEVFNETNEVFKTIVTELYTATISNRGGGSFVEFIINRSPSGSLQYVGGYNNQGSYLNDIPVSLILPSDIVCRPCLSFRPRASSSGDIALFNMPFDVLTNMPDTTYLEADEALDVVFKINNSTQDGLISKTTTFYGSSFKTDHNFSINSTIYDSHQEVVEVSWLGGIRPTEERRSEDQQYESALVSQSGSVENITIKPDDVMLARDEYSGNTDWVGVRSKYFITALLPDTRGDYSAVSAKNTSFVDDIATPSYDVSIGFDSGPSSISSSVYMGPLDYDHIKADAPPLDTAMNWGISLIKPISKAVLWILKFLHNTFNINYGVVLLLFAIMVRFITGPLTKKSFESSQNMQKVQPQLKKIQEKYKGDPQGLNRETMALYKKHGVNPLGGCLPILLQMPLLFALFQVFRSTIEFRGAPFFLWISDLSKPDIVIDLPFYIPIYGDGIAVLPLIMGATLILTMRMSSTTMDPSQKPIMYMMNGFFVLLFNTFPSGLNLYYTAYNILSFFQQRNIRLSLNKK